MSGHSKWANIKGNVFSKLSRQITLTVLEGGGITEPENNVRLRLAIKKAKDADMPKENIKRAIEKGVGPNKATIKEATYEAFAPGGAALIIIATTDNANRTLSEIRNVLERHEGKLANGGSITYLFQKCAIILFDKNIAAEDRIFDFAQKISAFDIDQDETHFAVFFPFENLGKLKEYIGDMEYEIAEIDYKPTTAVTVSQADKQKIDLMVKGLENLDDVHKVFTNC